MLIRQDLGPGRLGASYRNAVGSGSQQPQGSSSERQDVFPERVFAGVQVHIFMRDVGPWVVGLVGGPAMVRRRSRRG